ncbi:MAG: tRNA (adenosine(37)-N6)-threonylcarbamoyltransferase complex ATPase subunit type 1 TsaE [Alphaproteobacteria bacterium]|nr:tRNA (adenosine(37)-N6)-threonylcarbamoyltransferase complex ATPase subunit type 1 TsaE [Alphaproteobacteria bacterium]
MMTIAQKLAPLFQQGDIVALYGTLGVGKTTFVRALVHTLLGKKVEVPSPTFTLLQTYDTPAYPLYHFDFYRLKSPEEAYEIGIEDAFGSGLSLIEWPDKLGSILPKKHISITIEITPQGRLMHVEGLK